MWNGVLVTNKYTANLVLTGFMGTGKSTIGERVARALHREFLDMDALIVERTQHTIPAIFARMHEAYFRTIERGLVHELALRENLVISTGGGALVHGDNLTVFQATSTVICLTASLDVLTSRIAGDSNRPLASKFQELYESRLPKYQQITLQIDTSDLLPDQVTEKVISLWQQSQ